MLKLFCGFLVQHSLCFHCQEWKRWRVTTAMFHCSSTKWLSGRTTVLIVSAWRRSSRWHSTRLRGLFVVVASTRLTGTFSLRRLRQIQLQWPDLGFNMSLNYRSMQWVAYVCNMMTAFTELKLSTDESMCITYSLAYTVLLTVLWILAYLSIVWSQFYPALLQIKSVNRPTLYWSLLLVLLLVAYSALCRLW